MITSVLLAALITPGGVPSVPAPSPDVRDVVRKGLKWLAAKQTKDGNWALDNGAFKVGATSWAGLALLMEGSTLNEGAYSANIRAAVSWFEKIAQPDGLLAPANDPTEAGRAMVSQPAALLFLTSAYDTCDDEAHRKRLARLLAAAVTYTAEAQTRRGGWGFVRGRDGADFDESAQTAEVLRSLVVAERAGIPVPPGVIDRATRYLTTATNREGAVVYSLANGAVPETGGGQSIPTAGAAAVVVTSGRKPAQFGGWVAFARRYTPPVPRVKPPQTPQVESYTLSQYLVLARLANSLGEDGHRALDPTTADANLLKWSAYRSQLFPVLKLSQLPDGSWPDQYIGPAYSTSLALVILQLDNNYLPAFSR